MKYSVVFGFADSPSALFVIPDPFGSKILPQKVDRNGVANNIAHPFIVGEDEELVLQQRSAAGCAKLMQAQG